MANDKAKEELHRRLDQTRRMIAEPFDSLTKSRLTSLADEIEAQLAEAEARDTDAPSEL